METKTYCAATMAEAVAEVKRDLGRDAVILHTRSFRKGGLLGLGGRPVWEVTASAYVNVPQRLPSGRYVAVAGGAAAALAPAVDALGEVLTRKMAELHGMMTTLLSRANPFAAAAVAAPVVAPAPEAVGAPGREVAAWRTHLIAQGVAEATAAELAEQMGREMSAEELARPAAVRDRLVAAVAARIPTAEVPATAVGGRPRVIVLVGPTGVGKTTTIAKLAARFKLAQHRQVGLITIDTYRIAAVDQLKTYAQILEVPLRTVLRAGELDDALAAMAGLDVVLMDTAGRSPADAPRLRQMRTFLEAARPDEVHLVVSATADRACAQRVLDSFAPLGANRWILSKVDEAGTFGIAMNVAIATKTPLSFVTTGQEVPDDIAVPSPQKLAELIVGEGVTYAA
jgi:flagellar biosynthesis protein FlhF